MAQARAEAAVGRTGRVLLKTTLAAAFRGTGALPAFVGARRLLGGPRVHLLGFHRVVDSMAAIGPDVMAPLCITTSSFDALCREARRRFTVLSLAEAGEALAGRLRLRRDALVLTFDDAYRDVFLRALPVLRRHALPAAVFVPTGRIGSAEPLLHDRLYALLRRAGSGAHALAAAPAPRPLRTLLARAEQTLRTDGPAVALDRLIAKLPAQSLHRVADALADLLGEDAVLDEGARVMSAEELAACVASGMDLGAHTIDHVALTRELPGRVVRELTQPRRTLEAILGRPCLAFAYCNGLWNPSVVEAVRDAGYRIAVTTCDRPNVCGRQSRTDLLLLGRKVLHEGHLAGPGGRLSRSLLLGHLHDLFGALGLTRPVEGLDGIGEEVRWRRVA